MGKPILILIMLLLLLLRVQGVVVVIRSLIIILSLWLPLLLMHMTLLLLLVLLLLLLVLHGPVLLAATVHSAWDACVARRLPVAAVMPVVGSCVGVGVHGRSALVVAAGDAAGAWMLRVRCMGAGAAIAGWGCALEHLLLGSEVPCCWVHRALVASGTVSCFGGAVTPTKGIVLWLLIHVSLLELLANIVVGLRAACYEGVEGLHLMDTLAVVRGHAVRGCRLVEVLVRDWVLDVDL